jgi:hypothetical protein
MRQLITKTLKKIKIKEKEKKRGVVGAPRQLGWLLNIPPPFAESLQYCAL